MISEEEFQAALDAHNDDHVTRLVFADWLEEQGDERADGYRALARGGFIPFCFGSEPTSPSWWCSERAYKRNTQGTLPMDWFDALDLSNNMNAYKPSFGKSPQDCRRPIVEDAAARAFLKLPPERRAELLNPTHQPQEKHGH